MSSATEQRSIEPDALDLDPQDDELEQMLAQAERLATEMRTISSKSMSGASFSSGFPETIQIKDKDSVCSSMEVTNIFDTHHVQEAESFSSNNVYSVKEKVIEENEIFSADVPEVEIDANISSNSADLSDLSSTRRTCDDVDAIVQASQEMARALEAIQVSSPVSGRKVAASVKDTPDTSASSPRSLTPSPASPDSICGDSKTTVPISHLTGDNPAESSNGIDIYNAKSKIEGGDVTWEKVAYTREIDDDYVPIVDYSKKMTPPRKTTDKDGIKWEKLASPSRFDRDYSSMKDYSTGINSPKRKEEYSFAPDPLPAFGNQRRSTLRRLRKRQKRIRMAAFAVALAGLLAIGWWQWKTVGEVIYRVRLATLGPSVNEMTSAEKLAAKVAAEEAARHAKEKKAAADAAREAAEKLAAQVAAEEAQRIAKEKKAKEDTEKEEARRAAANAAEAAKAATEKVKAVDDFKNLCGNPLVSFLSPVCREKKVTLLKQFGVANPLKA
jgi:hypothetical protein